MQYFAFLLLICVVGNSFGFYRSDCSCSCTDGTVCIKATGWLIGVQSECQCKEGTCPDGYTFNGKVPCGSAWSISDFFRPILYPTDYATNIFYNKNRDQVLEI